MYCSPWFGSAGKADVRQSIVPGNNPAAETMNQELNFILN
jgi:hypothetical protein